MEKDKIEIIYQIISNALPLNKQTLLGNGFTEEEINFLIDSGFFKTIANDNYTLSSIKELYNYGVKLYIVRKPKQAQECFLKCFEIDSSDREVCLQLMYMNLRMGNIEKVLVLFKHLEKISTDLDCYDNNLYLYLLNLITRCPEEYAERLENLDYKSILIPENTDIPFQKEQNYIRQAMIRNKSRNSLQLQNDLIAKKKLYSSADQFLKELTIRVINVEQKFKNKILELAKDRKHRAIISFFDTKSKKRRLTNAENYAYLISQAIINISSTGVIPPITNNNPQNLYHAIKGNNFAFALNLEKEILSFYRKNMDENTVYILLSQINQLIYKLEPSDIEIEEEPKTLIMS